MLGDGPTAAESSTCDAGTASSHCASTCEDDVTVTPSVRREPDGVPSLTEPAFHAATSGIRPLAVAGGPVPSARGKLRKIATSAAEVPSGSTMTNVGHMCVVSGQP